MFRFFKKTGLVALRSEFRSISSSHVVHARRTRLNQDAGISKRSSVFENDADWKEDVEDEEDIAGMESDFSNLNDSYAEHKRDIIRRKDWAGKKITIKKFFSGPKPPNMLTWAERLQIKQLHTKDPEEWSLDVLAESFPATRETISKIISGEWNPENMKQMKRKDEIARENWELLAQGKLEADPNLLAHLQKFLHRREEYLSSLGTEDFAGFFGKPEPKEKWNNGQMSNILESYERALENIEDQQKMIGQGTKSIEGKSEREIIKERIEFEREINCDRRETFKMGGPSFSKQITFSELKGTLEDEEERGKPLDSTEKIILEKEPKRKPTINNRLARLAGYSLDSTNDTDADTDSEVVSTGPKEPTPNYFINRPAMPPKGKTGQLWKGDNPAAAGEAFKPGRFKSFKAPVKDGVNEFSVDNSVQKVSLKEELELKEDICYVETTKNQPIKNKEEDTLVLLAEEKPLVQAEATKIQSSQLEPVDEELNEHLTQKYQFSSEQDEFVKEEKSIEGTFFWSNEKETTVAEPSESKVIEHVEARVQISESEKKNIPSLQYDYGYPEKITIPKDKKGSGMTFRVNDCFYDDDGEFLYRVPGMTKTSPVSGSS